MYKYFKLNEFLKSAKADELGIQNIPTPNAQRNLDELAEFLDGVREAWGSAIYISSGYRCDELNKAVKGSSTSSHKYGLAVDLVPANGFIDDFYDFLYDYLEDKQFDQLINEYQGELRWVHFGLKMFDGQQRRMCLICEDGRYIVDNRDILGDYDEDVDPESIYSEDE